MGDSVPPPETVIDARLIEQFLVCPIVFAAFEHVGGGGTFLVLFDYEPEALHTRFGSEYPGICEWTYELQGPENWVVRIDRLVA